MAWQTAVVHTAGPTWIVMIRDVSHAVRIRGQRRVVASLILDADTGLARGISAAESPAAAYAEAMRAALTKPAGPLPPQVPQRVLCGTGQASRVTGQLTRLLTGDAAPVVTEVAPVGEAEDIFDSFVGHMAGRRQPDEFPASQDWQMLFTHAGDYSRAQPWQRWPDTAHLSLVVRIRGPVARYLAVVIGQERLQRGLVLYPGRELPARLGNSQPGASVPLPAGTLLFYLDPPDETPPEFAAKAARYGWPAEADLIPVWLVGGPDGAADLDRKSAHHLTVAIVALLAHDRRRAAASNGLDETTGQLTLAGGEQATFSIG
jgi:hypothetical protein